MSWKSQTPAPIAVTVKQIEQRHPGVQGRMRSWIHRADSGDVELAWLKAAIIRVGRSVLIDQARFDEGLRQRLMISAAPSRNGRSAFRLPSHR